VKSNTEYKNAALAALKGNWAKAVLASVVFTAIVYFAMGPYLYSFFTMRSYVTENIGMANPGSISEVMNMSMALAQDPDYVALASKANGFQALFILLSIFLIGPLTIGFYNALLRLLTGGENDILGNTFKIATEDYWHKVWGNLLMKIFIFLWSLLFIIPGIVKIFSYAMTPYILEENPELSAGEAIDRSRAMMRGHKFDLFWLYLSFIGWIILSFFTLGIGLLWLVPYVQTSVAGFYEDVKADYEANGGLM
jgi:uncharacterized membrane protein